MAKAEVEKVVKKIAFSKKEKKDETDFLEICCVCFFIKITEENSQPVRITHKKTNNKYNYILYLIFNNISIVF